MSVMTPRERVLGLLTGKAVDRVACYSGMGNVTLAGIEKLGYRFSHLHSDAKKMAETAATSYRLYGYECAVVPYDFCVEAEALGCAMNAYEDVSHILYPTIKEKAIHSEEEMKSFTLTTDITAQGRIPVVIEAIKYLKRDIGDQVAVGSYVLGPFTLAGQLMDLNDLLKWAFKKPAEVNAFLDKLADIQIAVARAYVQAGADYITLREMGATTDVLSPRSFKMIIQPHLTKILSALDCPKVLHICGSTNQVMKLMNECGADALSVEAKNDLAQSRKDIGYEPLLFGNLEAYAMLVHGSPDDVEKAVLDALDKSIDAIWPGCDIWPEAKPENMRKMVESVQKYGSEKWRRNNPVA